MLELFSPGISLIKLLFIFFRSTPILGPLCIIYDSNNISAIESRMDCKQFNFPEVQRITWSHGSVALKAALMFSGNIQLFSNGSCYFRTLPPPYISL